jgi:uncharacterized protein YjbI with pentapeptide repeats
MQMRLSSRHITQALLIGAAILASGMLAGAATAFGPTDVAKLKETGSCANCDLAEEDLAGMALDKADLSGANLAGAKLYKATLTEANLTGAFLANADLAGANLTGATGANFSLAKTTDLTICPDGASGPCK